MHSAASLAGCHLMDVPQRGNIDTLLHDEEGND